MWEVGRRSKFGGPGARVALSSFGALLSVGVSCSSGTPRSRGDAGFEGGVDVAADRPVVTGHDAAPDAGSDLRRDGSTDAPPDQSSGYSWTALPVPLGAQMTALAFDGEGVLYAGATGVALLPTPGPGIFKSTDEGSSWHAASLGLIDDSVATLAAVGTTMYAAAADLMRSTDRGVSWQLMVPIGVGGPFQNVSGRGDLVVAGDATGNPLYLSTDMGGTFNAVASPRGGLSSLEVLSGGSVILRAGPTGVFRSTDRGVTFKPVQGITNGMYLQAHLRCDGASTCYAVAFDTPNPSDMQVLLKSTDAGATWTPLPPQLLGDVVAISDSGSVYMEGPLTLTRSDDGGSTFKPIACPSEVDGSEPDCSGAQVTGPYVARGDQLFAARPLGVYRSDDKGQHWQAASGSVATGAITGPATWLFVDTSPAALGPNGDIYVSGPQYAHAGAGATYTLERSSDGGRTWQPLAPSFGAGQCIATPGGAIDCVDVGLPPLGPFTVGRSEDHGATWHDVAPPPGLGEINASRPLAISGSVIYLAGPAGVGRSVDDGLTFELVPNGPALGGLQALRNGHLLATQEIGNSTGDTGYRSTDQGSTWQSVPSLPSLPVVEDATGRLLRYTSSGTIEMSTDEATTWTVLASIGAPELGTNWVPFTIDGAGHLFAFGRHSADEPAQIFASDDGGTTFRPMPVQIPNANALSLAVDKLGRLLVGTSGGVFRLESNAGAASP